MNKKTIAYLVYRAERAGKILLVPTSLVLLPLLSFTRRIFSLDLSRPYPEKLQSLTLFKTKLVHSDYNNFAPYLLPGGLQASYAIIHLNLDREAKVQMDWHKTFFHWSTGNVKAGMADTFLPECWPVFLSL